MKQRISAMDWIGKVIGKNKEDYVNMQGWAHWVRRNSQGDITGEWDVNNLITNSAKAKIADLLVGDVGSAAPTQWDYIAIGTGTGQTATSTTLATEISTTLRGKDKNYFTPNLDTGDYVVVINAKNVLLSGDKEKQKVYYKHSGYPGGLKKKTASEIRSKNPQLLIRHAVIGMMPRTKLAKTMLKKLFVFNDDQYPYEEKFSKN